MKKELILKEQPTLTDFQTYVKDMVKQRGFTDKTVSDLFVLFLEECGEMAKAARKSRKLMKIDATSLEHRIDHEIADVFIYLLDIANNFNVDIEKAFREKEEINKKRVWK